MCVSVCVYVYVCMYVWLGLGFMYVNNYWVIYCTLSHFLET